MVLAQYSGSEDSEKGHYYHLKRSIWRMRRKTTNTFTKYILHCISKHLLYQKNRDLSASAVMTCFYSCVPIQRLHFSKTMPSKSAKVEPFFLNTGIVLLSPSNCEPAVGEPQ